MKLSHFFTTLIALQGISQAEEPYRVLAGGLVKDYGVASDVMQLHSLMFDSKPRKNHPIKVQIAGLFKDTISKGSKVAVNVKYEAINLLKLDIDFCDFIVNIGTGLKCPISPGQFNVSMTQKISSFTPPGKYQFTLTGYSSKRARLFKDIAEFKL
ncbi:Phosphatidylglycerol/phosphatidylinositol transfer protein [Entomophthora muscae]|uniref:Phosphatidylglycerol/phosphatidylinositol transfer protein n=1 Tax=Entomophthora muscae TaxID=34485 RepID=A0ACC2T1V5_9FUNG|nr:Phosphatidylglycerol/phosphatidylinositol transfer protein [Entomophthora muscae]